MFFRNKQGALRVSAPLYKLLLAAHVVVSAVWLGVVAAKLVLGTTAAATGDPDLPGALYLSMRAVDLVFPPAAVGTVITGVLLSLGTKWGLLEHYWVAAKLFLSVGVVATGVLFVGRLIQQSLDAPPGETTDATSLGIAPTLLLLLSLSAAHVLMLGAATILSVYKPWGKTWLARRKAVVESRSEDGGVTR